MHSEALQAFLTADHHNFAGHAQNCLALQRGHSLLTPNTLARNTLAQSNLSFVIFVATIFLTTQTDLSKTQHSTQGHVVGEEERDVDVEVV